MLFSFDASSLDQESLNKARVYLEKEGMDYDNIKRKSLPASKIFNWLKVIDMLAKLQRK